ncbi:MAG TPA: hypothetical protein VNF68_00670 [Candidatus Baltobacteraceae bacterium]|nr:hypothetical protein [Candidatus Baltobacteraceae bacterium]
MRNVLHVVTQAAKLDDPMLESSRQRAIARNHHPPRIDPDEYLRPRAARRSSETLELRDVGGVASFGQFDRARRERIEIDLRSLIALDLRLVDLSL